MCIVCECLHGNFHINLSIKNALIHMFVLNNACAEIVGSRTVNIFLFCTVLLPLSTVFRFFVAFPQPFLHQKNKLESIRTVNVPNVKTCFKIPSFQMLISITYFTYLKNCSSITNTWWWKCNQLQKKYQILDRFCFLKAPHHHTNICKVSMRAWTLLRCIKGLSLFSFHLLTRNVKRRRGSHPHRYKDISIIMEYCQGYS